MPLVTTTSPADTLLKEYESAAYGRYMASTRGCSAGSVLRLSTGKLFLYINEEGFEYAFADRGQSPFIPAYLIGRAEAIERIEAAATCAFCGAPSQPSDRPDECSHPEGQGGAAGSLP